MYQVKWLVDNRVALIRYKDQLTFEDVHAATDKLSELIESGEAPVHVLSVVTETDNVPTDLSTLRKSMRSHDKAGLTVIISEKPIARFVGTVLAGMSGGEAKAFAKLADGLAYLQKYDPTLPELTIDMIP